MSKENKTRTSRFTSEAFKEFAMEATEFELDYLLVSLSIDPEMLVARANAAIGASLKKSGIVNEEQTETKNHVKLSLHQGLSALIRLLRREKGLAEHELAERAGIDISEIQKIEFDSNYTPNPRTVYQLEEYFKLPERTLVLMSGAVSTSPSFNNEVLRFAAHSKDIGKLTREEKKLLNDFVKFLVEEQKKIKR